MTRVNNKLKLLIMLGLALLATLILGTTKVEAATPAIGVIEKEEISSELLNNILDNLNTNLDVKESECEKVPQIILNQISSELAKQNINVKNIDDLNKFNENQPNNYISIWITLDIGLSDIHTFKVEINSYKNGEFNANIIDKNITIQYNNSSNYNEADKKYVENILKQIPTKNNDTDTYMSEFYEDISETSKSYNIFDVIEFLKSNGIEFVELGGSGTGLDLFRMGGEGIYLLFKNGIYYTEIGISTYYNKMVIVPNDIEDTEQAYINYATPLIKNYFKNFGMEYGGNIQLTKIEKISGSYYKVYCTVDGYQDDGIMMIRKQEGTPVGNNIFVDNLPQGTNIIATVKENATMETELKNKGYNNILGSYELKLEGATKLTSPIDVTFNVGTEHNNKTVYILHQKQNGTYENFEKKVANGKVTVTVSELSPFVIGLKEDTTTSTETPSTTTPEQPKQDETKPEHKLDETPKTGESNIAMVISSILSIVSIVGIAAIKKF